MTVLSRTRWRRVRTDEVADVAHMLETWPCSAGGAARHMFVLSTLRSNGPSVMRVAEWRGRSAVCVVLPDQLIVPAGDPQVLARAGVPNRGWRIMVGDAAAVDVLLERWGSDPSMVVHRQRFQLVDPDRVPDAEAIPDPGLRAARREDVPGLAELAVQLHVDDGYGPHPGRSGHRAYRDRMERAVRASTVVCVGPPGDPLIKIERAVDCDDYGVQLAGICVRRDRRAEGLGRASVTAAVRDALHRHPGRPVALHVRADNRVALRTYATAGFVDREEWRLAVRT